MVQQQDKAASQEIAGLSALELAAGVRSGDFSARDVVEAHIERIEQVNGKLNALVIPLYEEARAQAKAADDRQKRGEPLGRLHGVPVTIKEQYRVAGTQTTLGAVNKIGNVYDQEGSLVTKLRQEGAIILGKTNILQTLAGMESDNRVYGHSSNPWDLDRSPGGSSGGEAAIVAAGGSALGLAGDYGGSTRVPAHMCGVHGFKATSGRLSNDDFPPDLLGYGQNNIIPQPGPIARTMADIRLAMAVFAETSLGRTADMAPPVPWPDPAAIDVKDLRVGYYTDNGYFPASPGLRRAVEEAAAALKLLGADVVPVSPPDHAQMARLFLSTVSAGGGVHYAKLLGSEKPLPQVSGLMRGLKTPDPILQLVARIMASRGQDHTSRTMKPMGRRSAAQYWHIIEQSQDFRNQFLDQLDESGVDALLSPPYALPAVTHLSTEHLFPAMTYGLLYNVLGAPAGVVAATRVRPGEESDRQVGRDLADITAQQVEQGSAGLPVGVQVAARYWREDVALAVMTALEAHFKLQPDYPMAQPLPI